MNPGALGVLQRHVDVSLLVDESDAIEGMLLTGPGGVRVRAKYGRGLAGRAVTREVLDHWLVSRASEAGASIDENALVKDAAIIDGRVAGVRLGTGTAAVTHPARMVIAADGRRSTLAIGRGLSRQPQRPRRWAVGSYFTDVDGLTTLGEMHVRRGHYIGVAPVPGGLTNACLVVPHTGGESPLAAPAEMLERYLRDDPELSPRFARARAVAAPSVLGPMAVDAQAAGEPGLLLAGDAAGFIDPMTGDGLHFALAGAELAAAVALDVLAGRCRSIARTWISRRSDRRRSMRSGGSTAPCDCWSHRRAGSAVRPRPRKWRRRSSKASSATPATAPGSRHDRRRVPVSRHCWRHRPCRAPYHGRRSRVVVV